MFSKAYSATIQGIDGIIVSVEADVSDGLPLFDMVGLLNSEVKEARERVRIALKNSGYMLPAKRITVNLSPADIRKEGTFLICRWLCNSCGLWPCSRRILLIP